MSTTLYRIIVVLYRGRNIEIDEIKPFWDATLVKVKTKHPLRLFPGAYFYIHFPGSCWKYQILTSHLMMAVWYDPLEPVSESVSFIVPRHGRHARYLRRLKTSSTLLLEGPYGQNLHLEEIENVCLVAKGLGILSVLPVAHHLAMRRQHDNTITQSIQNLQDRQDRLEESEQKFKHRDEQLRSEENELNLKREKWENSVKSSGGTSRQLEKFKRQIKAEGGSLREERSKLDQKKEYLRKQKKAINKDREKVFSQQFHSDSTRTINIFWYLDHNCQGEWASKYLQALQDSDPDHVSSLYIS